MGVGNMKSGSLLLTVLVLAALASSARATADILPPDRSTVWNPGIPGGIPARTTVCATINASTYANGLSSSSTGIQAKLDACPVGQVVMLSAGTFKITDTLLINKGIVLRGAGPTLTFLKMPDGRDQAVVAIGTQFISPNGGSTNLTANAVKGTTSVMVANTAGLAAGTIVLVDELTDASITRWSADNPAGSHGWFSRNERPLAQVMEVAGVVGLTVTFTTPFHIGFDMAHSAQLSRFSDPAVKNAGLEDLHVYGGEGGDGGGNIYLELTAYSWVKNVESEYSAGGSVALFSSFRCVVRDSYFHNTKDPNPGGAGYGITVNNASADNLIENNISWKFNKVMVMRASGGGNVIGYNYMEDGYGEGYPTYVEVGLNASHMTTPHFELFEGNQSFNIDGDARWGNSVYITFFRNHATGIRRSLGGLRLSDVGNRRAIGAMAGHYWYSFIGNVLGYPGMSPKPVNSSFIYQSHFDWPDNPVPMWALGQPDADGTPGVTEDLNVDATALRGGNFDYVTNTVVWKNVAQQTLPDSLYLTAKPAFFGSNTWPWVDPVGTTKLYTLPARARFDQIIAPPPVKFYTVTPCRVADTRNATGPAGGPALVKQQSRDFQVGGLCGVPVDARAVAANVTAVAPPAVGFLTLFPAGLSQPLASSINVSVSRFAIANNATVGLGTTNGTPGTGITVFSGLSGPIHFLLDVVGYYK
jgi:hypothetical protein